jgi:hypothetical protein
MIWNNVYEKGLVDVMHDHKDNPNSKVKMVGIVMDGTVSLPSSMKSSL